MHTGDPRWAWPYPGERQEGEGRHAGEHQGGDQHDEGHKDVVAEVGERGQPATEERSSSRGRWSTRPQASHPSSVQTSGGGGGAGRRGGTLRYVLTVSIKYLRIPVCALVNNGVSEQTEGEWCSLMDV